MAPRNAKALKCNIAAGEGICLDNCHGKLDTYYQLLDETSVYAASTVLNPAKRWRYFEKKWTSAAQRRWLTTAKSYVKKFWEEHYHPDVNPVDTGDDDNDNIYAAAEDVFHADQHREPSEFDEWLNPPDFFEEAPQVTKDEYKEYCKQRVQPYDNLLEW